MSEPSAEAVPCAVCETTGGHVPPKSFRPARHSGSRYGIGGWICHTCYRRLDTRQRRVTAPPCDLCGDETKGPRFDGAEFDLEGRICGDCRAELRDERAVALCARAQQEPDMSIKRTPPKPKLSRDLIVRLASIPEGLPLEMTCYAIVNRTRRAFKPRKQVPA